MDISIRAPGGVQTAKQVNVKFSAGKCTVSSKVCDWKLDLDLCGGIEIDDCTWTFNDGSIEVSMEKSKPIIWGRLLK